MRVLRSVVITMFSMLILTPSVKAQMSQVEYIEKYKELAIKEMGRSGVPASITLAQGILESGNGNSALAKKANNHFGIKCHSDWNGPTYIQDDDKKNECFRKYKDPYQSFYDHSEFLQRKRYESLFQLKTTDYKGWAHGLKKAGYATNPKYPKLLIDIIERNELMKYDQQLEVAQKKKESKDGKKEVRSVASSHKASSKHQVRLHQNNIKYVEVIAGESINDLAHEFNMGEWQIYKYNDLEKNDRLEKDGIIYLQPKRGKAKQEYHTVSEGESMWGISQKHGIKLKKLYKKNRMDMGEEPSVGTKLYLRRTKR